MRIVEKKGPFSAGSSFRVGGLSVNDYVHVGIQIPKCQPISPNWKDTIPYINKGPLEMPKVPDGSEDSIQDVYKNESLVPDVIKPDVMVTTLEGASSFYVNRLGIIEFDVNVGTTITVRFLKNMPPETIVDLVYDESVI